MCSQLYLTASGLWYSALLIDAIPTLIICIRSFETSVLSNALLGFQNGEQALFYYVSIASVVFTEDITQSRWHLISSKWPASRTS